MADDRLISPQLQSLGQWYDSPCGVVLRDAILHQLGLTLPQCSELLYLGVEGFEASLAQHRPQSTLSVTDVSHGHLLAEAVNALPLKPDSQECAVLLHGLDATMNPHAVLREFSRVIAPNGHLVVVGFNAFSLWGAYRPLRRCWQWHHSVPWNLNFYPGSRVRDWLELLNFTIVVSKSVNYRPLIQRPSLLSGLRPVDNIANMIAPQLGNVYIIVAKKQVVPLTPHRLRWTLRARFLQPGLIKPSIIEPTHRQAHQYCKHG